MIYLMNMQRIFSVFFHTRRRRPFSLFCSSARLHQTFGPLLTIDLRLTPGRRRGPIPDLHLRHHEALQNPSLIYFATDRYELHDNDLLHSGLIVQTTPCPYSLRVPRGKGRGEGVGGVSPPQLITADCICGVFSHRPAVCRSPGAAVCLFRATASTLGQRDADGGAGRRAPECLRTRSGRVQGHVLSLTTRQEIHLITCEAEDGVGLGRAGRGG